MCKSARDSLNVAGKPETLEKSLAKSRGIAWKDKELEGLIELMKEETIMFGLENAKTPKEKRAISNHWPLRVSVQNRRSIEVEARINNN